MNNQKQVMIGEEDFRQLKQHVFLPEGSQAYDEMSLAYELSRALVVPDAELPADVIRLDALVSVEDMATGKISDFILVLPDKADIRQRKISILTPMGAALIGFRLGDEVTWKMPAGIKKLRIRSVSWKQAD